MIQSILLAVVLSSVSAGPIKVGGPTAAEPGSLVTLEASGGGAAASYTWVFVQPAGHPFISDGRRIGFATKCRPENYIVVLLAISLDAAGKPTIDSTTSTIIVGGDPVPPGPVPPPPTPVPPTPVPPTPTPPDVPAGRYGLARVAYDASAALSPNARARASAVAATFRDVASAAAAGAYSGTDREKIDKANGDISTRNRAALGPDAAEWGKALSSVGAKMGSLWNSREMVTLADHVEAYREISAGLSLVK